MCGRYTVTIEEEQFKKVLGANAPKNHKPRYNAAPGQFLPVLTHENDLQWQLFKWGLVPGWAQTDGVGNSAVNARIERIEEKPSFKYAFYNQRCLVIADSYYEWKGTGKNKIPYRIMKKDESPFLMAGLWEVWNKGKKPLFTFTIITLPAKGIAAEIHDRMPAIFLKGEERAWLEKSFQPEGFEAYINQNVEQDLKMYPITRALGSVKNDYLDLIKPSNEPIQGSLF